MAGVALKYGISLADLRRANQLWATDSIHLREVLYIPIESLQNSKQYKVALAESDANASLSREESPESPSTPIPDDEVGTGVGGNLTLRRVPASQLSFFPRPTTSASASNPDVVSTSRTLPKTFQSTSRRPDLSTVFPPSHLSTIPPSSLLPSLFQPSLAHASFLPTRSHLSSLFNALPLAPSTRDTIISRLSLDSVTSTPTQSSDDQELELDNVGSAACRRERPADGSPAMEINGHSRNDLAGFLPLQGTARSLDAPLELHSFNAPIVCPSRSPTRVRHSTPHHCVSEYTSPEVIDDLREPIRTSQLQPSPSMHLPLIAKRDKVEGS